MFGASTIDVVDGQWVVVYNDSIEYTLEDATFQRILTPRNGEWRTIYIGRVQWWEGEVTDIRFNAPVSEDGRYQGLVVVLPVGNSIVCPAPHLEDGTWAACDSATHECWRLERHTVVKLTDVDGLLTASLRPTGRYVYQLDRYPSGSFEQSPLGLVAFDLEHLPIHPQEYAVRNGVYFSTNRLVLSVDLDRTQDLLGTLDSSQLYRAMFWSD